MSWTEERIGTLRTMWEGGQTASQIAEALGGVSRNAVIGKAHRLGLQSRPSPVVSKEEAKAAAERERVAQAAAAAAAAPSEPEPEPVVVTPAVAPPVRAAAPEPAAVEDEVEADVEADDAEDGEPDGIADSDDDDVEDSEPVAPKPAPKPEMVMRSVGPGGFVRQSPGEQAPPSTPAPPRRLVPARTSAEFAHKTSLLDLSDKICKWPLGHPGEPDFHFCGDKVNPGFPYCVQHCGHAYQAQLPRRDRRAPPIPFGGPRAR